jgi:hypothetical protein
MLKRFLLLFCLMGVFVLDAHANYRVVVIDAGSSGSRLHVYDVSSDSVTEAIQSVKSKPGLSSFVNITAEQSAQIDKAGLDKSLQSLITSAQKTLPDLKTYPVYVYATAGMRLLDESAQQLVMDEVKKVLEEAGFSHPVAQVISGEDEALYDWIAANTDYLLSSQKQVASVGILDMGGASLEVAYEIPQDQVGDGVRLFKFRDRTYPVYAKTYLGLGLDQTVQSMNAAFQNDPNVCYPKNTWGDDLLSDSTGFNYASCEANSLRYLQDYSVEPVKSQEIVFKAFSGFYYVDAIFQHSTAQAFSDTVNARCQLNWNDFILADNHQTALPYLQVACHQGVYLETLLKNALHVPVTNVAFESNLDWTKGVALFEANQFDNALSVLKHTSLELKLSS